ncbi:MFS transporter [Desertimonas flava]|uniref:MFS transporter n=1 Tax=Desertimonas flava TaxID=2064846 RepID=UPI000E345843|nr:MFS transporter [Desertimonas flava]
MGADLPGGTGLDRRAVAWGLVGVVITMAVTFVGSDRLVWFDAALIGYLYGVIFMVFGVIYRYRVWVRRPPTAMLNRRGWEAFRRRLGRNVAAAPRLVASKLVGQTFIRHRSRSRWAAHQLVFWGCILAAAVTFPLTLGLLHFESVGQRGDRYQVFLSRVGTIEFDAESVIGWFMYHALDVAAVLVLAGVFIFLHRRLREPGALATERSGDFLALVGLFAVSVTGLFLTVSSLWLDGRFYAALSTIHALTVILGLMYLPFGKFFHIFQRPANVGVAYYKQANEEGAQAVCRRCGREFAGVQHVADLQVVLAQLGFDYGADGQAGGSGSGSFQDTCPRCRRAQVALAQSARVSGFG